MCNVLRLALVGAVTLTCLAPVTSARADDPPPMSLTVTDGKLSLEAQEVPLQAILDEIADRAGVQVRFDDRTAAALATELVTTQLHDVPLEEALRLLLRGRDLVFVYTPRRLSEARVYGGDKKAAPAPPPAASVRSAPAAGPPATAPPAAAPPAAPQPAASPAAAPSAAAPPASAAPDPAAMARLRSEALESPDPAARWRALEAIAASGDRARTRDVALAMLDRESDAALLQRALDLVEADGTIPLEPLVKLALSNPASEVRIKALAHLGADAASNPRARQALEASAANDPAPPVREAARALLQQLAPR